MTGDGVAILVMLNNYLHDLATAVFAVSAFAAWILCRSTAMQEVPEAVRPIAHGLMKIGIAALVWTLLAGGIRSATYREYEWMEAAGRGQVAALVVKHVILVSLVLVGIVVMTRLRRLVRAQG